VVLSSILNTGINIRGLGSPYGPTNDGIDPGVGFMLMACIIRPQPPLCFVDRTSTWTTRITFGKTQPQELLTLPPENQVLHLVLILVS
jgi:hypothetical protein